MPRVFGVSSSRLRRCFVVVFEGGGGRGREEERADFSFERLRIRPAVSGDLLPVDHQTKHTWTPAGTLSA